MKSRLISMIATLVASAAVGFVAVLLLGKNLNGGTIFMPGIGHLHRLSLSQGPTSRSEIDAIQLQTTGADDHMRVFLNNYVTLTTEDPCAVLGQEAIPRDECNATRISRNLQFPKLLKDGYSNTLYPKQGVNHLVVELENDIYAYCTMFLGFQIDGFRPTNYLSQTPVSPETARALNEPWDNLSNSICSRRIYQFWLE